MNSLKLQSGQFGPIVPTYEFYEAGYSKRALARAVARGEVVRVRQGWYSDPTLHPDVFAAARVGGRLTGVSLAALVAFFDANGLERQLWVPPSTRFHVAVPRTASRLRTRHDYRRRLALSPDAQLCLHWVDWHEPDRRCIASPLEMLAAIVSCEPPETAIILADSALNAGLVSEAAFLNYRAAVPGPARATLRLVDARAESGIETIARLRLAHLGVPIRPQFVIGRYRVDLLLGSRLILELEGFEHHHSQDDFDADHARAAELSALGYRLLSFSYRQVMYNWPSVEASVRAALYRGDHL